MLPNIHISCGLMATAVVVGIRGFLFHFLWHLYGLSKRPVGHVDGGLVVRQRNALQIAGHVTVTFRNTEREVDLSLLTRLCLLLVTVGHKCV